MIDPQVIASHVLEAVKLYAKGDTAAIAAELHDCVGTPEDTGAAIVAAAGLAVVMMRGHGYQLPASGYAGMIVSPNADGTAILAAMQIIVAFLNDDDSSAYPLVGAVVSRGPEWAGQVLVASLQAYGALHAAAHDGMRNHAHGAPRS